MVILTCPRCLNEITVGSDARFCPRCGLANVQDAASDSDPVVLKVEGQAYLITDRLAVGSLCSLYRCSSSKNFPGQLGVFKLARDSRSNSKVSAEARILRHLTDSPDSSAFVPFLPRVAGSFTQGGSDHEPPRQANVLVYHSGIDSPDNLYTLHEVKAAYPRGLDAKDVAWIWRRLLNILSFSHGQGVAHAAVLPGHVLIEPTEHKLVLIDWCFAKMREHWNNSPSEAAVQSLSRWFSRDGVPRPVTPALDIALGARCMMYLMEDDSGTLPRTLEPSVRRHFERSADLPAKPGTSALELLSQFDQLIEALWGPRQFRPLTLPKRG